MGAKNPEYSIGVDTLDPAMEEKLYSQEAEIKTFADLQEQRGTAIPALFSQFFKFIQNPSTVSVETYKRMIDTDDTIGSGVDFLTTCLMARLGRYQHKSHEITAFVNKALEKIDGGWEAAFKEGLSGIWNGFMVQEKVWKNTDEGFLIDSLVTLPPSTVLLECSRNGKITDDGILQYQRNYNPHLLGQGLGFFGSNLGVGYGFRGAVGKPDAYARLGDFPYPLRVGHTYAYMSIRIPKQKAIHFAYDAQGRFGNPYGRSLLRRTYKWYILKDTFLNMLTVALDRKGTPLMVVYADPNQTMLDHKNFDPSKPAQQQRTIRPEEAVRAAVQNIHNDSVIILPGKKDQMFTVDSMSQQSNASDFIQALDFCNKSILRGLLIPSLIFGNGDGTGSFALGQEHSKTFDKILDGMLAAPKTAYLDQLIRELIAYNFPKSAWEKDGFGDFGKRDLSKDELDKEMEMYEKGINLGVIDSNDLNDLNKMREAMGFEEREEIIQNAPLIPGEENGLQPNGIFKPGQAGDSRGPNDKTPEQTESSTTAESE